MIRYLLPLIIAAIPTLVRAEVWRCEGDVFTSDVNKLEHLIGCKEFHGSRVCGSGANTFITPLHPAMKTDETCAPQGPSLSPFVRQVSKSQSSDSNKRNFERKLASTLSKGAWGQRNDKSDSDSAIDAYRQLLGNSPQGAAIGKGLSDFMNPSW